jgi:hypothetical protein
MVDLWSWLNNLKRLLHAYLRAETQWGGGYGVMEPPPEDWQSSEGSASGVGLEARPDRKEAASPLIK